MSPVVLSLIALLSVHYCSTFYVEQNPALGQYQDESKCFPLQEDWYMKYRNYETDPLFGKGMTCIKLSEIGPENNGAYPIQLKSGNDTTNATVTLSSSLFYTTKNVLNILVEGEWFPVHAYSAYKDITTCDVLRLPYANLGACALFVPESQLGENSTCCDFIFDLLCGTTPKYYVNNEDCATSENEEDSAAYLGYRLKKYVYSKLADL